MCIRDRAAGVQIINSGGPGEAADIRIRGYSSNSGNIGPLLIVDGLKAVSYTHLASVCLQIWLRGVKNMTALG